MAERGRALGSLRRVARSLGSARRETGIALVAYGVYSLVRGVFGGTIEAGRTNAAHLIDLEDRLGMLVEPDLQRAFIDHHLAMPDRKSTRLNSSHIQKSRMPSSA